MSYNQNCSQCGKLMTPIKREKEEPRGAWVIFQCSCGHKQKEFVEN